MTHTPTPVTLAATAATPLPDDVTRLLRDLYASAADYVANKSGVPLAEVAGSPEIREAVLQEFVISLPYRPHAARMLAEALTPRACDREGCTAHVSERARWCSPACRQWGARQRRRAA